MFLLRDVGNAIIAFGEVVHDLQRSNHENKEHGEAEEHGPL